MKTDRDKLLDFVSQRIDHSQNPESFRYQLQLEISQHLKQEQQQLKKQRTRVRNQQLQEQEIKRREQLQTRLDEKCQKGNEKKMKRLEDRVKSMSELRRRKEEYTASKLKESRKMELKRSLEKIKQFDKEREDLLMSKLIKTESDSQISKSLHLSHLQRRNQTKDAEYDALVLKLQSKGLFSQPYRKGLSQLYAQKAKFVRSRASELEGEAQNRLGAKLQKIEGARERKEEMLREKASKLKQEEQYQRQLKKSKLAEMQQQEKAKRKKMQAKEAMKVLHIQSIKQLGNSSVTGSRLNVSASQQGIDRPKIKESSSFRKQIRRHIQQFKQNSKY